jgi:DNA-binding transcriptional MerR regulator
MVSSRIDLFKDLIKSEVFQFGISDLSRITGVSTRQLRYWEEKGVITPLARDDDNSPRTYNFKAYVKVNSIKHFMDAGDTLRVAVEKTDAQAEIWHNWYAVVQQMVGDITEVDGDQFIDMGFFDQERTQHLYAKLDENNQVVYQVK